MTTIDLSAHCRVRIWINELPLAAFPPEDCFCKNLQLSGSRAPIVRAAAVEYIKRVGPRSLYGLLGGVFTSLELPEFRLEVNIADECSVLFSDNLAKSKDAVYVGLPREYLKAIEEGFSIAGQTLLPLFQGSFKLTCAAHHPIASCGAVYKSLLLRLVQLLKLPTADPSQQELMALFSKSFC